MDLASASATRRHLGEGRCVAGVEHGEEWRRVRSGSARANAESKGDPPPSIEIGRGGRQVQDDPADGDDDMHAELEQPLAQPADLRVRAHAVRAARSRSSCINT